MFPGDQTTLTIPIQFFEDPIPENIDEVSFSLTAEILLTGSDTQTVPVEPSIIAVGIYDNEGNSYCNIIESGDEAIYSYALFIASNFIIVIYIIFLLYFIQCCSYRLKVGSQ